MAWNLVCWLLAGLGASGCGEDPAPKVEPDTTVATVDYIFAQTDALLGSGTVDQPYPPGVSREVMTPEQVRALDHATLALAAVAPDEFNSSRREAIEMKRNLSTLARAPGGCARIAHHLETVVSPPYLRAATPPLLAKCPDEFQNSPTAQAIVGLPEHQLKVSRRIAAERSRIGEADDAPQPVGDGEP